MPTDHCGGGSQGGDATAVQISLEHSCGGRAKGKDRKFRLEKSSVEGKDTNREL